MRSERRGGDGAYPQRGMGNDVRRVDDRSRRNIDAERIHNADLQP